jgi:hypothetical protein
MKNRDPIVLRRQSSTEGKKTTTVEKTDREMGSPTETGASSLVGGDGNWNF